MRRILFLAPLLCLAGELRAQSFSHWLEPGTRVRVTAPTLDPPRAAGRIASLLPDTLVLARGGGELPIANHRIDLIEVSQGPDRRRGVRSGAILGLLVGAGVGATSGALGSQHLPTGAGASAGLGFLGGALLGGGIGAGLGVVFAPERWQGYRIEHPATAGPDRRRRPR